MRSRKKSEVEGYFSLLNLLKIKKVVPKKVKNFNRTIKT